MKWLLSDQHMLTGRNIYGKCMGVEHKYWWLAGSRIAHACTWAMRRVSRAVGGDVEGHAEAQVARSLVHLAAQLAVRHVELWAATSAPQHQPKLRNTIAPHTVCQAQPPSNGSVRPFCAH